jgi:hypothetical protein
MASVLRNMREKNPECIGEYILETLCVSRMSIFVHKLEGFNVYLDMA